jgi:hypothetical protein
VPQRRARHGRTLPGENSEHPATTGALTAISLQPRQSLWGGRGSGSVDFHRAHDNDRRRETMVWKSFISQLAITSQRKILATAIVYAISLIFHFISPVGEGTETRRHSVQRTNPLDLRNTIYVGHPTGGGNVWTSNKI